MRIAEWKDKRLKIAFAFNSAIRMLLKTEVLREKTRIDFSEGGQGEVF